MRTLVALMSLFSGCVSAPGYIADYDDAMHATVRAWEAVIGRVSEPCYQWISDTTVVESKDVYCGDRIPPKGMVIAGCAHYWGGYPDGVTDPHITPEGDPWIERFGSSITIRASMDEYAKADAAVHEWIHLLSRCMYGAVDINHGHIEYWITYGDDTVEALGCAGLTY